MRHFFFAAALAAAASASMPASAGMIYASGAAGGVSKKSEHGVTVWRGRKPLDAELAGGAPAPRAYEAPSIVIEVIGPVRPYQLTQGFWSGEGRSLRYTQGFYSGPAVRRGRTVVRIYRRPS